MDTARTQAIIREIVIATCKNTPQRDSFQIRDGYFVFTITGNQENWPELIKAMGVPDDALRTETPEQVTFVWPSFADIIFGADGILAQEFPGYEMRTAQLYAGRLFQRGIEMGTPVVTELPTGTGKSLIYLLVARAMGKKLIVSTSNRALQMQLYFKDAPYVATLFPSKISLAQGKSNYICLEHEAQRHEEDHIDPLADHTEYQDWIAKTVTGNIQEIDFEVSDLPVVNDDCSKKHCGFYEQCFYYKAKTERAKADIIICNHALTALDQHYPLAQILPHGPLLVVDEAHQLEQYVRNAYSAEFTLKQLDKLVFRIQNFLQERASFKDTARAYHTELDNDSKETRQAFYAFAHDVRALAETGETDFGPLFTERIGSNFPETERIFKRDARALIMLNDHALLAALTAFEDEAQRMIGKQPYEVGIAAEVTLEAGKALTLLLDKTSLAIWDANEMPLNADDTKRANLAQRIQRMNLHLKALVNPTPEGHVRWLGKEEDTLKLTCAPLDVSEWIALLAGFQEKETPQPDYTCCTRCGHKLTAPVVHLLNNQPFGPTCITYVDPFGDSETVNLQTWLGMEHPAQTEIEHKKTPLLLTSATLTTPTFAPILRSWGFPYALTLKTASPFDYENHSLLYVPTKDAPDQNDPQYQTWLHDQIRGVVYASEGGAFLLFTSNKALTEASKVLAYEFSQHYPVFMQGRLPKMEIIRRMRQNGNAVLFATKSFFEGVDIPGQALRLVVLDKMPFQAQTPFSNAQAEALRTWARKNLKLTEDALEWYPFNEITLPTMIIDLKQGAGRLIRTRQDKGVIVILDKRIVTTTYGRRQVLPALPASPQVNDLAAVQRFFASLKEIL